LIHLPNVNRHINEIIVHCTATPPNWRPNDTPQGRVKAIRNYHVDGRGWSDIGYHILIDRPGVILEGRPIERMGAHVSGKNENSIGVSLFGAIDGLVDDDFLDNFTEAQDKALREVIDALQEKYGPGLKLSGHNEYANRACPTFDVKSWYAEGPKNIPQEDPKGEPAIDVDDSEVSYSADYRRLRWRLAQIRDVAEAALDGE